MDFKGGLSIRRFVSYMLHVSHMIRSVQRDDIPASPLVRDDLKIACSVEHGVLRLQGPSPLIGVFFRVIYVYLGNMF